MIGEGVFKLFNKGGSFNNVVNLSWIYVIDFRTFVGEIESQEKVRVARDHARRVTSSWALTWMSRRFCWMAIKSKQPRSFATKVPIPNLCSGCLLRLLWGTSWLLLLTTWYINKRLHRYRFSYIYIYTYIFYTKPLKITYLCWPPHPKSRFVSFFLMAVLCPNLKPLDERNRRRWWNQRQSGNIFQKLEKVQGALEMCQKALNDFMVSWIFNQLGGFYRGGFGGVGVVSLVWRLSFWHNDGWFVTRCLKI